MDTKNNKDLGTGDIKKLMFSMALPAIAAQIINVLYNIVDRIYIGRIPDAGALALTGVGISFPIIIIITAFSSLIGMGGAPQAAIAMGRNDYTRAEKILGTSTTAIIILSLILTLILHITKYDLLMFLGASENTIEYAMDYLGIYALGTLFIQFVLALNPFITTQGFASISMKTTLLGAITNIILDPIFIFGFGLGVKGAAIATILSQALSAIWVLRFLTSKKTTLKIKKEYLKIDIKLLLSIIALGVSPFVMQSTESILTTCFNTSLKFYGGDTAVGAMAILASCMQFILLPLMGLTQGSQPIISYNYGAGNIDRVTKTFKILIVSCFIFTSLFWIAILVAPHVFTNIFTNDVELSTVTSWALRIYMFGMGIFGIQIACQQTFIALGQAKISVFIAILRKVILLIPLIYILPNIITLDLALIFTPDYITQILNQSDKVFAIFAAEPIADIISVIITAISFKIVFSKIKNLKTS